MYLKDNAKARVLQSDGSYSRAEISGDEIDAQLAFQQQGSLLEFERRH